MNPLIVVFYVRNQILNVCDFRHDRMNGIYGALFGVVLPAFKIRVMAVNPNGIRIVVH